MLYTVRQEYSDYCKEYETTICAQMAEWRHLCRSWLMTCKNEKELAGNIKMNVWVGKILRTGARWKWFKMCPMAGLGLHGIAGLGSYGCTIELIVSEVCINFMSDRVFWRPVC